jgi:hypothetical protein
MSQRTHSTSSMFMIVGAVVATAAVASLVTLSIVDTTTRKGAWRDTLVPTPTPGPDGGASATSRSDTEARAVAAGATTGPSQQQVGQQQPNAVTVTVAATAAPPPSQTPMVSIELQTALSAMADIIGGEPASTSTFVVNAVDRVKQMLLGMPLQVYHYDTQSDTARALRNMLRNAEQRFLNPVIAQLQQLSAHDAAAITTPAVLQFERDVWVRRRHVRGGAWRWPWRQHTAGGRPMFVHTPSTQSRSWHHHGRRWQQRGRHGSRRVRRAALRVAAAVRRLARR